MQLLRIQVAHGKASGCPSRARDPCGTDLRTMSNILMQFKCLLLLTCVSPCRMSQPCCDASARDQRRMFGHQYSCPQGPCCHDALSAKLIEQADFDFAFMSGFCTSAAYAGLPDTGLMSYAEMLHVGRCIHESTSHIPIIGDGDTGYGNAVNVKRTVNGYASAGFAGTILSTCIMNVFSTGAHMHLFVLAHLLLLDLCAELCMPCTGYACSSRVHHLKRCLELKPALKLSQTGHHNNSRPVVN